MIISEIINLSPKSLSIKLRHDKALVEKIENLVQDPDLNVNQKASLLRKGLYERPVCKICTKKRVSLGGRKGFLETCEDKTCKKELRSIINKQSSKKIDWKDMKEKISATSMEKYGVDHPLKSQEIRERQLDTIEKKWGKRHALQNKELQDKRKKTCENRHQTLDFFHNENAKATNLERYGNEIPMRNSTVANKVSRGVIETKTAALIEKLSSFKIEVIEIDSTYCSYKCISCGKETSKATRQYVNIITKLGQTPCEKCNPRNSFRSGFENEVFEFVRNCTELEIHMNRKYIKGREVDIIIPELKLAIDCNGVYWHSEIYRAGNHHIEKKKVIESQGYKFIQIWEDDWRSPLKNEIVKSRILNLLGGSQKTGARKYVLCNRDYSIKLKDFLDQNHLQGFFPATEYITLEKDGQIYALASFRSSRDGMKHELSRYCLLKGHSISGVLERFISHFKKNKTGLLFSYADLDWSSLEMHNTYDRVGFSRKRTTSPGYFWLVGGIRVNRHVFMRHKLRDIKPGETEVDYMHSRGYYRVYNSGNLYYEMALDI